MIASLPRRQQDNINLASIVHQDPGTFLGKISVRVKKTVHSVHFHGTMQRMWILMRGTKIEAYWTIYESWKVSSASVQLWCLALHSDKYLFSIKMPAHADKTFARKIE